MKQARQKCRLLEVLSYLDAPFEEGILMHTNGFYRRQQLDTSGHDLEVVLVQSNAYKLNIQLERRNKK
jgi:hypothetical protein